MPKTTKRSAKSAAQLARELVDRRLDRLLDLEQFTLGGESDHDVEDSDEWLALVRVCQQEHYAADRVTEEQIDKLAATKEADRDVFVVVEERNAIAGFLVGVELGRRLAGAR